MRKNLLPFIGLILISCGQPSADQHKTAKEEAVILQDSALKVLKQKTDVNAVEKSIALLNQAIERDPQLKSAYFHKMNIYKKKGDNEGIFKTLIESNENNPGDAFTTLNLGREYESHGDIEKANIKYDQAVLLFESALDTLPEEQSLIRNTYILNMAMAKTLANQEFDLSQISNGLDAAEIENLKIALNAMKAMSRENVVNMHKESLPEQK